MIILEELSNNRVYRYLVVDTETEAHTFPYESPIIAITQFVKGVCRSSNWNDREAILNSYDITAIDFYSAETIKDSLYRNYPELLL